MQRESASSHRSHRWVHLTTPHSSAAVTGMPIGEKEIMQIGERIWNVQKLFNMKEGYTKADDTLPDTAPYGAPRRGGTQRQGLET